MNRFALVALLAIFVTPAAAGDWQNPDAEWVRVTGADIESRVAGREMLGKYVDGIPRGFRAVFRRNGDFTEDWSPAVTLEGRRFSTVGRRWFIDGDLICEEAPVLADVLDHPHPFCVSIYEMADANAEAYRFVDPETGALISFTTEVRWIEPPH